MFDDAHELTGCHPPYAMDAEREAIKAMRKVVLAALLDLPQRKLLALGRKLHELADARDFEIDQLQRDYEEYPLWKLSCSTPRRSRRGSGTFGGFGTPSKE